LFQQKAALAGLAELDENQIKIMIIKLQQIEKLLKELGKDRKKRAKLGVTNSQLRKTRRNST
jgi:ribosomal protein S15P/S13E